LHFSQKRELFLFPITTLLPSLIVRFCVAVVPSLEGVRGRFSSSFLYLPVQFAPSFVRLFYICPCDSHHLLFVFSISARAARTVFCSSFVRSLFVICSSFLRLFFVIPSSARAARTVICLSARAARTCPCGSHLLVRLTLPIVLRPRIGFLLKLVPLRGFGGFCHTVTYHLPLIWYFWHY